MHAPECIGLPQYLRMDQFHVASVDKAVSPEILSKVRRFSGEPDGLHIKDWLDSVASAMMLIPKASKDPPCIAKRDVWPCR